MIWTFSGVFWCTDEEDGGKRVRFQSPVDSIRRETKRSVRANGCEAESLVSDCGARVCDYSLMINAWRTRTNASVMAFDKPTQHQGAQGACYSLQSTCCENRDTATHHETHTKTRNHFHHKGWGYFSTPTPAPPVGIGV